MNELEKLRADLVLAGWRIERNSLKNNLNLVDWYAWHPLDYAPCSSSTIAKATGGEV